MITPMLRPDLFGAFATHAGDAAFEHCFIPGFAACVRGLRAFGGDIGAWWEDFRGRGGPLTWCFLRDTHWLAPRSARNVAQPSTTP